MAHLGIGLVIPLTLLSLEHSASPDPLARALVQRALDRLQPEGAPVQQIILEAQGIEDLSAEVQGHSWLRETPRAHRELLVVDRRSGGVAYERRTPRTDYSLRWRRFMLLPGQRGVVDLANGFGVMRPARVSEADLAGYRRRVPHFLLEEALSDSARLRWLGPGPGGNRVAARLTGGVEVTLTFDREAQLVRVEYPVEFPGIGDTRAAIEYDGWQPHPRLGRFPTGHRVLLGSRAFQRVTYGSIRVDDPATDGYLRIPPELDRANRPAPAVPVRPLPVLPEPGTATPLGEGVYLVNDLGGFQLVFVDLGGEVLAFDAPAAHPFLDAFPATNYAASSAPVSREYIALIRRTLPGVPLRYVVISHAHSDHAGGVREFMAAGATVLAAATDTGMIRALERAPHTHKSGLRSPGMLRLEAVAGRRVIAGRNRSVEILQVGSNPHTEDNLVLWLPGPRLLFQGDLFYHRQGESPPPDRETMNRFFAEWLAGAGLVPERMYGVHNSGFATRTDLIRLP